MVASAEFDRMAGRYHNRFVDNGSSEKVRPLLYIYNYKPYSSYLFPIGTSLRLTVNMSLQNGNTLYVPCHFGPGLLF